MSEYLVRASALEGYDNLVRELAGNPAVLRTAVGISATPIPHDSWISYRAFIKLLELSAERLNCPHFGLSLSRHQDISILGSVGFVMREAPDVATALTELSKYFAVHNQGAEVAIVVEDGVAKLSFEDKLPGATRMGQQLDLVLGIGMSIMRLLCGKRWNPLAAYVAHPAPVDRTPYRKIFDCPIHFNAEVGMFTFPADTLAMKISSADDQLHRVLAAHLALIQQSYPDSYPDQIRYLIRQALFTGDCSVERVAGYLSVTKRTLQRQLKSEDTSYKALLEDVRFNIATRYLVDSKSSLTVLADMLGYSELSAFSNAFKLKTGKSPREWRAQYAH
jgi:AraC-like DNA-binding protein